MAEYRAQNHGSDLDTGDLSHTAQRVAEIGRETASKAASYVRDGVDRATGYAHHLGDVASGRIADMTGQPPEHWAQQLRHVVEQSPLKALGVAIAAGYLVGRVVRRV
jgi:hypothetical protein